MTPDDPPDDKHVTLTPPAAANTGVTTGTGTGDTAGAPQAESPRRGRGRRQRLVLLVAAVLVLAGAAGGWLWFVRAKRVEPPMPADIRDREVLKTVERARKQVFDNPRSAVAWGRYGMTLLGNLFDREADRCFAEAARLDPNDPRWPYCRGLIALKRDSENALPFLRQAAEGNSRPEDQSAMRLQLAEALLERRQMEEAEALFREEWRRRPGHPRAGYGLGLIAVLRGEDRDAEKYLTAAQSSRFAQKTATSQLAALARARGDEAAAAGYEKAAAAMSDDPAWPDPLLDEIVQLQVGHRGRERQIGQLEFEERYAEAADLYLLQIAEEPTVRAYVGAGINLARIGKHDRALKLLREAVRLDPENAHAQYTLALTLFGRAEKEWQNTPGAPTANEAFREAATCARRAAELRPGYARAYLFWGLSLKYLGDSAEAVAPLRKGVACLPAEIELQLGLGEALLETGQLEEAAVYLENARKLDPKDSRPEKALERLRQQEGKGR